MNVKWQQAKLELRKSANTADKNFMPWKHLHAFVQKSCNDRAYKMRQRVNTVKKAESENLTVSQERTFSVINQKEYLSIKEVGILLGITSRARI